MMAEKCLKRMTGATRRGGAGGGIGFGQVSEEIVNLMIEYQKAKIILDKLSNRSIQIRNMYGQPTGKSAL